MAKPTNYSKWDHIEVSDDEDDTHPNVDTPSLFKWRHEARIQREEEARREKAKRQAQIQLLEEEKKKKSEQLKELVVKKEDGAGLEAQLKGLGQELAELEKQQHEFLAKEAEIERLEKEHPQWNVDNISKDSKSRTIINKDDSSEKELSITEYFDKYKPELKHFGMLSKLDESQKYLKEHPHLVCDHLASFLIVHCVDLESEGKHDLMARVAHQTIIAQFIVELAKSVKRHPRQCVDAFFSRIRTAEKQYKDAFDDELSSLKERVQKRAVERRREAEDKARTEEEAARKEAEEERLARLGPGGLDPLEVLETLPAAIREAFENKDTPKLQAAFAALSPEDASYHFKRVIDSGLWVPAAKDGAQGEEGQEEEQEEAHEDVPEEK